MARVLLVQPPHRDTFGYSMPPLGPLHLAATARRRGHVPRFLDLALLTRRGELPADDDLIERCAERVAMARPEVVGLTSMVSSLPAALHLAAAVRAMLPEVPLILGGQGPEQVEEAVIARHPAVDAVAVGEADGTFTDWLEAILGGGDPTRVPGLVVRREGRPFRTPARPLLDDLDVVDSPAWDLAESPRSYAEAAGGGEAMFPIDLGRGCTFGCRFCTTPVFWGRRARHLSPARAVDELDRMAGLNGLDCAYVTHDLFTFDRDAVMAMCAEKRLRGNTLPWECRTRLDLVDDELLAALHDAGCRRILYGVESDRPAILAAVDKGGRSAQLDVRSALRRAAAVGMASIVGTMAGVPGETAEDLEANLRLMADVAVIDGVSLSMHWFNVLPGNGQADTVARLGGRLELLPGLHADLVRGYDLPAGRVLPEQQRMIRDDPEIFAAFRVFGQPHATPEELYLLSRNAHLLLEVLPRSVRALSHATGLNLSATLLSFLTGVTRTPRLLQELLTAERAGHGEPFEESRVLARGAAVRLFSAWALQVGEPLVDALVAYERALFETEGDHLQRFGHDPTALVRAMDAGTWPPAEDPPPGAVLFSRRGEVVRAHGLSPFLCDAFELADDGELLARWPDAGPDDATRARAILQELTGA